MRYSSTTEPSSSPELLADRLELLAQEVLALLLLGAGLDVLADAAAHLQLGEPVPLVADGELEPLDDVDRLQQLDPLLEAQVGRVGAGVGEGAGLDDRAQELADPRIGLAQLEDLLDDGAVLGLQVARLDGRRRLVGLLLDLDVEPAVGAGLGSSEQRAVQPGHGHDRPAAREAGPVDDLCDRADLGVGALMPRHEQDVILGPCVELQCDGHVREDDGVVQRNQQVLGHGKFTLLS